MVGQNHTFIGIYGVYTAFLVHVGTRRYTCEWGAPVRLT